VTPAVAVGAGRGRVIDPEHDARVVRGAASRETLQAAYLALVERGRFKPSLAEVAAEAGVPVKTVQNYYPRLSCLGAAVADRVPLLVLRALALPSLNLSAMSQADQLALAHALLAGERNSHRGVVA
jgi:AcrR family transcriptional regulator